MPKILFRVVSCSAAAGTRDCAKTGAAGKESKRSKRIGRIIRDISRRNLHDVEDDVSFLGVAPAC